MDLELLEFLLKVLDHTLAIGGDVHRLNFMLLHRSLDLTHDRFLGWKADFLKMETGIHVIID